MTYYNWKDELDACKINDESLPTKELYAFRQYAAKEIAEKQGLDYIRVLEQLWGGELSLWAIRTTSMLYQLLRSWYGDTQGMEQSIHSSFYYSKGLTRFLCFASLGSKTMIFLEGITPQGVTLPSETLWIGSWRIFRRARSTQTRLRIRTLRSGLTRDLFEPPKGR